MANSKITARGVEREEMDVRTSGKGRRKRVDAYFVLYHCPADEYNLGGPHDWICRFEVPRGAPFRMQDFDSKKAAMAARGFVTDY